MNANAIELSIVMPCLNEAETLGACIRKATHFLRQNKVAGEVVIADNGSTDGSQQIANSLGARVVQVPEKGYGSALMGGCRAARGKYLIMGDSDDSYDFGNLTPFLENLRNGSDLVMGNRFQGGIEAGAMPPLHRYLGNPVLSFLGRLFFSIPVGDFHCGLRGFSKEAFQRMNLTTPGMEFASEMVVKASLKSLKISEVPTTLSPDGRSRPPHLRTWHDGWRHLRFLLAHCPKWLYFFPGVAMMLLGLAFSAALVVAPVPMGNVHFDLQSLLYSAISIVAGYQFLAFYFLAETHGRKKGIPPWQKMEALRRCFSLERGLLAGLAAVLAGGGLFLAAFLNWQETGFGNLDPSVVLRQTIPSGTLILLGLQTVLYSFLGHILSAR